MPIVSPSPSPSSSITSNIRFNDIRSVYLNSTWVNGSADNKIVVVSERDDIQIPLDGTEWEFSARYKEVLFSKESQNNTDASWVVYKGGGENVTVFNLKAKTKYYFYFFEYNIINDSTVYLSDFVMTDVTTAGDEATSQIEINVIDSSTRLPIQNADITLINRNQNIVNKGRTSESGLYVTTHLPTGGIFVTITAPGYNAVTLKSVFIKNMSVNKSSYKAPTTMSYDIRLVKTGN